MRDRSLLPMFVFLLSSGIISAEPFELSPPQMQAVIDRASDETSIPTRARVSGVTAAKNVENAIYICGYVSAIDASGFYGPRRAFHTGFKHPEIGSPTLDFFAIAESDIDQLAIEGVCVANGIDRGAVSEDARQMLDFLDSVATE